MNNTFEQYENKLSEYLLKTVHHTNRLAPEVQMMKPEIMLQTIVLSDMLDEIKALRNDIAELKSLKEEVVIIKENMNKAVVEEKETSKSKNKAK